nr:MAG: hypothetical protein [Bacteriophage sp.]
MIFATEKAATTAIPIFLNEDETELLNCSPLPLIFENSFSVF